MSLDFKEEVDFPSMAGVMDEEYLFWDNQTFMNQIGLGK